VVFLDGEGYGLYTFAHHVDGDLMETTGSRRTATSTRRTHDANFRPTKSGDDDPRARRTRG
jgi:hypothetical protein